LDAERASLRQMEARLAMAEHRLDAFLSNWEAGNLPSARALSLPETPEDRLLTGIQDIRTLSFDVRELTPQARDICGDGLAAAKAEFERFVQRIGDLVSHFARIETSVDARLVAVTAVGWTGDFDTTWQPGVTLTQMAQHRQNVQLALARRARLVRLMIVIGAGAAKIIIRLATPGAQLLVLPALWQFVQDVYNELKQL
jgi:hypothetical protein